MLRRTIAILLIILSTFTCYSQKVGLVLSGGGAKGISHIGLIKVLEENNIPIDYVAGTSIGAIVAGLYASGMSPDEMLELFKSDNFKLWSTGKMDKDDLYYFRRNDESPEWLKLDITKKGDKVKLILPINLIPERQMDFGFLQLMAQTTAACDGNFDNLMVPFRCVSTDIYHNEAIVLSSGDVGEAIRASMTVPLIYKPIEKDGMLLFDGGMVNNFPTNVMQEDFHPDIIIGHKISNIGTRPDPDDVIAQIETMITQITNYDIPDSVGILLNTELDDVGLLDFPKADYTYSRGLQTGLLYIDSIKSKIKRRVPKEEVAEKREKFNAKKPELKFNNIQVEGVRDNLQRKYIIQSIKYKENIIDIDHLRSSYFKLIADDHIKSIRPIAYYNKKTGYFDLHLKVETRKPFDVAFGGHISTRANTFGYLQGNLKMFNKQSYIISSNLYFGKFYNSIALSGRIDFPSQVPFYISAACVLNYWDYNSTSTDLIFTDIRPTYVQQNESNIRLEVGIPFSKTGLIDFGASQSTATDAYYQIENINSSDELDETVFKGYSTHIRIDKKNYDYKQYPTEGGRKMFSAQYISGTENFTAGTTAPVSGSVKQKHNYFQMKGVFDQYFKSFKNISLGAFAEASINNNTLFSNYTSSKLNASAFTPTPNSKSLYLDNFRSNQYFALGGKIMYHINDNTHIRSELYGFFPILEMMKNENSTAYYNGDIFTNAHAMGLLAFVAQTAIGPLSVEVNYYDKTGQKFFFSVNMGYMLFNKRGF